MAWAGSGERRCLWDWETSGKAFLAECWGPEKGNWEGGGCDHEDSGEWLLSASRLKACVASHCLERPPSSCPESWRGREDTWKEGSQVLTEEADTSRMWERNATGLVDQADVSGQGGRRQAWA